MYKKWLQPGDIPNGDLTCAKTESHTPAERKVIIFGDFEQSVGTPFEWTNEIGCGPGPHHHMVKL